MLQNFGGWLNTHAEYIDINTILLRENITDEQLAFSIREILSPSLVGEYVNLRGNCNLKCSVDERANLGDIRDLIFDLTYNPLNNSYVLDIIQEDNAVARLEVAYKDRSRISIRKSVMKCVNIGHNVNYLFTIAILTITRSFNESTKRSNGDNSN